MSITTAEKSLLRQIRTTPGMRGILGVGRAQGNDGVMELRVNIEPDADAQRIIERLPVKIADFAVRVKRMAMPTLQ